MILIAGLKTTTMTLDRIVYLCSLITFFAVTVPSCSSYAEASDVSIDSLIRESVSHNPESKYSAVCLLRQHYKQINIEQSVIYARMAVAAARELEKPVQMADALNNLAILYTIQHTFDSALVALYESLEIYSGLKDQSGIAKVYTNLGIAYAAESYFYRAILSYYKAIHIFISIGDKKNLAKAYLNLGQVYENVYNPDKALHYFSEAEKIFETLNDYDLVTHAQVCMGIQYLSAGNYQKGLAILSGAKEYYLKIGKPLGLGVVFHNLGRIQAKLEANAEALLYYNEAIQIADNYGDNYGRAAICLDIAELFLKTKNIDSTLKYLNNCESSKGHLNNQQLLRFHSIKADIFILSNQFGRAVNQYTIYTKLLDSLYVVSRTRTIEELDSNFVGAYNSSSFGNNVNTNKINRNRQWVLAGFSLAGFLFSFLVMALLYQKRQSMARKKEIAELERVKIEHEKRLKESELKEIQLERSLQEEEMAKIKAEIQLREQELVFQTLCRMDLAQVNKKVHERLLPYHINFSKKKDQDDYIRTLNEITRESNRDSLADFELTFTQLHHGFFERLLQSAPELSKSEIMVCALLRLNLSSKDIARLLNLSLSTVDVTRHHIRRKLGLDVKDNLTAFLISI